MSELQNKLNLILNEKTNKILPENIKSGINIFGVSGNVTSVSNNMYTLMKYLPVQVADGYPYTNDSLGGYDFLYPTYMWEPDDYISLPNIFYFSVLDRTNNNFKVYWTDSIGNTYVDYDESNSQLNLHIDSSLPESVFCSTLQVNNLDVLPLFSDSVNGYNSGWVESLNKYSWNTVNMRGRETSITYNLLDINLEFYVSSIRNAADVMQEAKIGSILEGTTAYDKFGNILSGGMSKRTNVAVLNSKIVPSENVINISPRYAGYYATNSVLQINNLGLADKIGLTPNILKANVSVLNIDGTLEEGINTSDATATVDDIVLGKTAYVNGVKLTGTLENLEPVIQNQANIINNLYNTVNLLQAEVDNKSGIISSFIVQDGMKFGFSNNIYSNGVDWDTSNIIDMGYMFYSGINIVNLDVSNWDTSNVQLMSNMFYNCSNLKTLDVSNWNIDNVQLMSNMFYNCQNLTDLAVSNWNTSKVQNMQGLFGNCKLLKNINVSNWDVSNVTNMRSMFVQCNNLLDINVSNWNTSKVTDTSFMFQSCSNLTNINVSNWDVSNVTNMQQMFYMCTNIKNIDVSNWNTNKLISTSSMFFLCFYLKNIDVSNWDVSNLKSIGYMFQQCNQLSNNSIDSIINMCLNATNVTYKNLKTTNSYSPFYASNITNLKYSSRLSELTNAGWTY